MSQRTRTRGTLTASAVGDEEKRWSTCSESAFTNSGNIHYGPKLGEMYSMIDSVVPDFYARSRRGEVFFNPMTSVHESAVSNGGSGYYIRHNVSPLSCSGVNRYQEYRRTGDEFQYQVLAGFGSGSNAYPHSAGIITAESISRAISEASTHARSQVGRSNANLFEDWAEREKSLGMLSSLSKNVIGVLNKTPLRKAKEIGNAYLLYRYGLKPLVSDIHAVVKAMSVKTERKRASSRGNSSISESSTQTRSVVSGVLTYSILQEVHDTVSVRAVSLDEYVTSKLFEAGISSKGLLTLPWELIPYSFVVDWFANIGDFVGSLVPSPYFNNLGSCISVEREIYTNYSMLGTSCPSGTFDIITPLTGSMSGFRRTYSRSPGLPAPSLVVKTDFGFSRTTRVADAFALILQRLIR